MSDDGSMMQFPLIVPQSDWMTPEFPLPEELFSDDTKEIGVDVETCDPNLKELGPGWARGDGHIVGFCFAVKGFKCYLPVKHRGGGNMDDRLVRKVVQRILSTKADKIMHNAQYDIGWLRSEGFTINGKIKDTMVAASLIDENRFSYSLNALAYDYLNKAKSEKGLVEAAKAFGVDPKAELWKLPACYVGPYAETDPELTLELYHALKVVLEKNNIDILFDLEMNLLPILVEMTLRGIRIDVDKAEKVKQELLGKEKKYNARLKELAGFKVDIWSADLIAKAMDKLGMTYPRTDKGKASFTKDWLNEHTEEFPQLIAKSRSVNKAYSNFIDGIMKYVTKDGRVHSHINQVRSDDKGTVSGRFSMNSPAMQTIPARDPYLGPLLRSLFLPEEGELWASIDFSQQEPRILVHYAKIFSDYLKVELPGVAEFLEQYRNNPATDFHQMVADMAGIPRKQAKTINLALIYGMGKAALALQLELSEDASGELVNQYHDRVPFVKRLTQGVQKHLEDPRSKGIVRSLLGRTCHFDMYEPSSYGSHKAMPHDEAVQHYGPHTRLKRAYTYRGLNRIIQASAADMTKKAMVDCFVAKGKIPLLQMHDELVFSIKNVDEALGLREIMEAALPLEIPNKTDIEIGPNWGELVEI